jgi:hypothetical protein
LTQVHNFRTFFLNVSSSSCHPAGQKQVIAEEEEQPSASPEEDQDATKQQDWLEEKESDGDAIDAKQPPIEQQCVEFTVGVGVESLIHLCHPSHPHCIRPDDP